MRGSWRKGDFAVNSWGVAEYEEEDEEIEDVEMRLQSVEDWAVAMAFNDMEDALEATQIGEATQSADSEVDGQENVAPQPQISGLCRQLHPLFASGMIPLTLNFDAVQ